MITIYNPTYLHTYMENTKIIELKDKYETKKHELSIRYKDSFRSELEKEFILGRYNQLLTVTKDLERLLK